MKNKIAFVISALVFALTMTACGSNEPAETPSVADGDKSIVQEKLNKQEESKTADTKPSDDDKQSDETNAPAKKPEEQTPDDTNILVAYFSRADENYSVGTVEVGNTQITISQNEWNITGSRQNSAYKQFIHQRNSIMDSRVATWQEYLKMAADSTLKHDDEVRMVRQDSLLNDSLQRMIVECINRGDALGRVIRERYGKQLDQEHARQLK